MRRINTIWIYLLFSVLPFPLAHADKQQSPFRAVTGQTSPSVDTLRCVMSQIGQPMELKIEPWRRARFDLERIRVDGLFATLRTPEVSRWAEYSAPLALEKWYFYATTDNLDFSEARIGVLGGGNEERWLVEKGYKPALEAWNVPQLVDLLNHGRVDAILIDSKRFQEAVVDHHHTIKVFPHFVRFAPLDLAVSRQYMNTAPDFLATFNRAIGQCVSVVATLSATEELRARKQAMQLMESLEPMTDDLRQALVDDFKNNPVSAEQIHSHDERWRVAYAANDMDFFASVLQSPLSARLKAWQQSHETMVAEVFLINRHGAIMAMSQPTDDYWQGNEAHFVELMTLDDLPFFIGHVEYDDSTRRFLINIARPFLDSNGTFIGSVMIGVDIEMAMEEGLTGKSQGDALEFEGPAS